MSDCIPHNPVNCLLVLKPQLHFCRMDIYIQKLWFNRQTQHCKRIPMLHHKRFIGFFNGSGNQITFNIAPVYKVILKIPVISGNHRFSNISFYSYHFMTNLHFQKIRRDFPPKNCIDNIFQTVVS